VSGAALGDAVRAVRQSGLISEGSSGVVLVSGGADSAALAASLAEVCGPERLAALHLNYRLRPDSDEDEGCCRLLCARLGVELVVERPELPPGNVQAAAREARYEAAERLRRDGGMDWIATGHTRTDLAETVLYRLVTSPGRRALLGLPARRGRIVRPLLSCSREALREQVTAAELPFRDDPSNESPDYARNRIRNEVLPVLREIGPAAEETIAETQAELAEEQAALESLVGEALEQIGPGVAAVGADALADLSPAVRRLVLRDLAERAAGHTVALGRRRAAEIWRLLRHPEGGVVELGGGVEARIEHGHIRFASGADPVPEQAELAVPGSCRFGSWEVTAELREHPVEAGPDAAVLDAAALEQPLLVRAWREGDRMRPRGLGGSKSLQDLFTDRKVPRSLRRTLPVVVSGGRIAWVAGVADSEEFAVSDPEAPAAILRASLAGGRGADA